MCLECTILVLFIPIPISTNLKLARRIILYTYELFCLRHNDLQLKCINLQDVTFQILCSLFLFNFSEPFDSKFHVYQKRKRFQPNLYSMMCKFGSYQINTFENMSVCLKEFIATVLCTWLLLKYVIFAFLHLQTVSPRLELALTQLCLKRSR